jgi:hypothetical protein
VPSRSALAASLTLTASLISGAVAMAATTAGPAPSDAAGAATTPATSAPSAPATATPPAGQDPLVTLMLAVAAENQKTGTAAPGTTGAAAWFAAASGGAAAGGGSGSSGGNQSSSDPSRGTHTESPSPSPTPPSPTSPAPTTTPTTAPPYNCSGSDDGMSEAYKHAREEYCHAHGEGD